MFCPFSELNIDLFALYNFSVAFDFVDPCVSPKVLQVLESANTYLTKNRQIPSKVKIFIAHFGSNHSTF